MSRGPSAVFGLLVARGPRCVILFTMSSLATVKVHAWITMDVVGFYFPACVLWAMAGLELVIGYTMTSRYWRLGAHATWVMALASMVVLGYRYGSGHGGQACGCFGGVDMANRMQIGVSAGIVCTAVSALLVKESMIEPT